MLSFKKINVNPKNRITSDCAIRALASCLHITWDEALTLIYEECLKTKYDTADIKLIESILKKYGYVKMKQPKDKLNHKYIRVFEMDQVLNKEQRNYPVLIHVKQHFLVIEKDNYIDSWDSGSYIVGKFFMKVR